MTPPKTEHQRIDLSAMRLALACSVMMRCASFTHECPLRTLRVNVSSRWLSPPETTSEYRTYAHKTHAHTHATLSKKYGASRTTFRGRTATHHWPVTVVLLLTEVPRHRHASLIDVHDDCGEKCEDRGRVTPSQKAGSGHPHQISSLDILASP